MTNTHVLVTGATGRIGGHVVDTLVNQHNLPTRVLVRDEVRAAELLPPSVETIVGDFNDPGALTGAMQNVAAVLLVSPVHPDQRQLQGNVVRAAHANGLNPHIVKVSGLGTTLDSYVDSGRWHAETERDISNLGLPFTFLRPLFFMQNLGFMMKAARKEGVIRSAIQDARIAMVDVRDIADVAVAALIGDERLRNCAVTLTEKETHSYHDVARLLSVVLDRKVEYLQQSREQIQAALESRGEPEWHRRILDQFNRAFLDGWGNKPTDVVGQILDRPPRTLKGYLDEAAQATNAATGRNPFPS